jgi:hypothetical protein
MTANDLKLYHSVTSPNSRRVRIFLAEKGLTLPLVPVDLAKGEQHSVVSPSHRLPSCGVALVKGFVISLRRVGAEKISTQVQQRCGSTRPLTSRSAFLHWHRSLPVDDFQLPQFRCKNDARQRRQPTLAKRTTEAGQIGCGTPSRTAPI